MLAFVNVTFGVLLAVLAGEEDFLAVAFPMNLNSLGEIMFNESRYPRTIDLVWPWSLAYVVIVCGISLALIARKTRSAEVGQ